MSLTKSFFLCTSFRGSNGTNGWVVERLHGDPFKSKFIWILNTDLNFKVRFNFSLHPFLENVGFFKIISMKFTVCFFIEKCCLLLYSRNYIVFFPNHYMEGKSTELYDLQLHFLVLSRS